MQDNVLILIKAAIKVYLVTVPENEEDETGS